MRTTRKPLEKVNHAITRYTNAITQSREYLTNPLRRQSRDQSWQSRAHQSRNHDTLVVVIREIGLWPEGWKVTITGEGTGGREMERFMTHGDRAWQIGQALIETFDGYNGFYINSGDEGVLEGADSSRIMAAGFAGVIEALLALNDQVALIAERVADR